MTKENYETELLKTLRFGGNIKSFMKHLKVLQESINEQFKKKEWVL